MRRRLADYQIYQAAFSLVAFLSNGTATTELYTLSLHDALPISPGAGVTIRHRDRGAATARNVVPSGRRRGAQSAGTRDRKSTRLNSSHSQISYAVFCLKKKKNLPLRVHIEAGLFTVLLL